MRAEAVCVEKITGWRIDRFAMHTHCSGERAYEYGWLRAAAPTPYRELLDPPTYLPAACHFVQRLLPLLTLEPWRGLATDRHPGGVKAPGALTPLAY